MKKILLLVHDDDGLAARAQAAIDLTRALRGELICLELTVPSATGGFDPCYGTMLLELETRGVAQVALRARLEASGLPLQWIERRGEIFQEVAEIAEDADLIVLSSSNGLAMADMHGAIGALLVRSGKCVLAVPAAAPRMTVGGEAMLLWDGSEEAKAAMLAATPLFRLAANVLILEVDDGSLQIPALAASTHLSQRNVRNSVRSSPALVKGTGRLILEQVELLRPAYVVMGGYGHPRFVEGIFGGVTRRLLDECPVPILLKH